MNYFSEVNSVASIKYLYRQLAMKFHPDRPDGSTEAMQEINRQYQAKLKSCNRQESDSYVYYYNERIEQDIVEMIDVLLSIQMQGVDIDLIGTWIWVTGRTKKYKEDLKAVGCMYHSKRKCWYYHDQSYRSTFSSNDSLEELAEKFGVTRFSPKHQSQSAISH